MPRTYDLIAFQDAGFSAFHLLQEELLYSTGPGNFCTGVQKLVQSWLVEFLTERGSFGFHLSSRGTDFVARFRNQQFPSEQVARTQFAFAAIRVQTYLETTYTADTPLDEQLDSATLEEVIIQPGRLKLVVQLTTKAGDSVNFAAPIMVLPNVPTSSP